MTLDELMEICAGSQADDWNVLSWGPNFLNAFTSSERPGGDNYRLDWLYHDSRASYKPNLAIGMAWGLDTNPRPGEDPWTFDDDWATSFPDPQATRHFLDFFYNGSLVAREPYISVDSRCDLPQPRLEMEGDGVDAKVTGLTITQLQYKIFRLLNSLGGGVDYERYVRQAGFNVDG